MRINKLSVIDSKKVFENKQIFGMSFCLQRINKLIELNSFNKKNPSRLQRSTKVKIEYTVISMLEFRT